MVLARVGDDGEVGAVDMRALLCVIAFAVWAARNASAHDRHGNAAMHQDVHVQIGSDEVEVTFQIESNEEG
jgi:predicted secreted protein